MKLTRMERFAVGMFDRALFDGDVLAFSDAENGHLAEAYGKLSHIVYLQFSRLVADGWRFTPTNNGTKLPNMRLAFATQKLEVYQGHCVHPFFSETMNWKFRAAHDVLGYGPENPRTAFSLKSERQAYKKHACQVVNLGINDIRDTLSVLWVEVVGQAAFYAKRRRFPFQAAFFPHARYLDPVSLDV
ncbi:MAG: hypothetical protein ACRD2L_11150 [Terriglobia bacterium]